MDFIEKTSVELEAMTAAEVQSYWVAKVKHEKAETKAAIAELKAQLADSTDKDALRADIKELKSALKDQGVVIKGLRDSKIDGEQMIGLEGACKKALLENQDLLKSIKENGSKEWAKMHIKAVGDITRANSVTGQMPQAQRLDGVNDIAERSPKIYDLIPKLNVQSNVIEWVYESGQEGSVGATAEGASKNKIDNDFVVTSVTLSKQTGYFKVSTELLDDVNFMAGWLRNKLAIRLFVSINALVLTEVLAVSTAWAAGAQAATVDLANDLDSLNVGIKQIQLAEHEGLSLAIFMNPSDIVDLKLVKYSATDKRYINKLYEAGANMRLGDVPIIAHTGITVGDFLIADMSLALLAQKEAIQVEIGLDGNDFTKNMRTILAEWRGVVIIENNDRTAFVKGTFATTNAALEIP